MKVRIPSEGYPKSLISLSRMGKFHQHMPKLKSQMIKFLSLILEVKMALLSVLIPSKGLKKESQLRSKKVKVLH